VNLEDTEFHGYDCRLRRGHLTLKKLGRTNSESISL
jgi:hypothetical protein